MSPTVSSLVSKRSFPSTFLIPNSLFASTITQSVPMGMLFLLSITVICPFPREKLLPVTLNSLNVFIVSLKILIRIFGKYLGNHPYTFYWSLDICVVPHICGHCLSQSPLCNSAPCLNIVNLSFVYILICNLMFVSQKPAYSVNQQFNEWFVTFIKRLNFIRGIITVTSFI